MVNDVSDESRDDIEKDIEKREHDIEELVKEMDMVIDDKVDISELAENLEYVSLEGFKDMVDGILKAADSADGTYEEKDNERQEIIEQSTQAENDFSQRLEKANHNITHIDSVIDKVNTAFDSQDYLARARDSAAEEKQFFDGCLELERTLLADNFQKRHDQRYQLQQINAKMGSGAKSEIEKAVQNVKGPVKDDNTFVSHRQCSEFRGKLTKQINGLRQALGAKDAHSAAFQQPSVPKSGDMPHDYKSTYKKPLPDYDSKKR